MNAITICQPYASLIVGWPGIDPAILKRVENRNWPGAISYRGPLLIHAGRSTAWLSTWDGPQPPKMPLGYLLGTVELVACQSMELFRRAPDRSKFGWVKDHLHASGPMCLVLRRPRRLLKPIAYKGRQGLFDVELDFSHEKWEPQCRVCGCTDLDACPGGCSWIEPDLCSRCFAEKKIAK